MKFLRHIAGIFVPAMLLLTGGAWAAQDSGQKATNVVMTVNRVIYPGQIVPPDAVVEIRLNRPLRDNLVVIRDPDNLIGKVASKTILPRRLILPDTVRDAFAIEAGDPAVVFYRQGGLEIAMDAIALSSAGFGDLIRVRNTRSGRTVTGIVMQDGTVSVEAR
jgi:flagella basal body P-ring formation protein FlgA